MEINVAFSRDQRLWLLGYHVSGRLLRASALVAGPGIPERRVEIRDDTSTEIIGSVTLPQEWVNSAKTTCASEVLLPFAELKAATQERDKISEAQSATR